jgi:hypothetical protein
MRGAGAGALLLALVAPASPAAGEPCGGALPGPGREAVESAAYVVVYRPRPAPIAVGRHFSLDLAVCPRGDAPPPETVRVDALMPEHRHGMNYAPAVTAEADGRYRADGLLLHMPGRWELVFEVRARGRADRLTRSLELE